MLPPIEAPTREVSMGKTGGRMLKLEHLEPSALQTYEPTNKVRIVTATALFDGHDASINIMRRLLQARGAEVIHLGHNRTAAEIVTAAVQEDVQAVALSSYQGGHIEFFRYVREMLDERGAHEVQIFGGGGGVIVPREIAELEAAGITKIYSPEDGQRLGLDGIIGHLLYASDFSYTGWGERQRLAETRLARALTLLENRAATVEELLPSLAQERRRYRDIPVLGITGTGGAGKSSLTDELMMRFLWDFPDVRIGMLCIDPSKKKTGGALLGDRIRINTASDPRVFIRSFATRGSGREIAGATANALNLMRSQDFDFVIVETSGIGQGDTGILDVSDLSLYVMTSEFGAQTQLEKIDMLDYADLVAINKFERQQAPDALRDVRTQMRRTRFNGERVDNRHYAVFGTIASRFSDNGTNGLYQALAAKITAKVKDRRYDAKAVRQYAVESTNREALIPSDRTAYLSDIARVVRAYHASVEDQVQIVKRAEALEEASRHLESKGNHELAKTLWQDASCEWQRLDSNLVQKLAGWSALREAYRADEFVYYVR